MTNFDPKFSAIAFTDPLTTSFTNHYSNCKVYLYLSFIDHSVGCDGCIVYFNALYPLLVYLLLIEIIKSTMRSSCFYLLAA